MNNWQPIETAPRDGVVLCRDAGGLSACANAASEEPHTCPYKEEIHNDRETKCRCCADCRHECAMDV